MDTRRNVMKKLLLFAASLLIAATASVRSFAQLGYIQGEVPFSFTVSGKTLPAGEYRIISSPHQLKIQDGDGKVVAFVLTNNALARSGDGNDRIVFHCFGDRCFLAEAWSSLQGRVLIPSRAEAELAKEKRAQYFAVLAKPQK
jgi:hypothetical protein